MTTTSATTGQATARRATPEDTDELIRLRRVMMDSLGAPNGDGDWVRSATEKLREWLAETAGPMTAYVVDAPDGSGLAASAMGAIHERLPSSANPSGLSGYVFSVSTDPRWRRRGYARAVLEELLGWYAERGVDRVDLHASDHGVALYRDLGFIDTHGTSLSYWRTGSPVHWQPDQP